MVDACAASGSTALVGAPVDGPHIALLAVDGSGVGVAYRKMWLGGPEPGWFRAGDEPAVLEVDGWRFGLAVCKDTGVPRHAADTAALGIDAYLAATLKPRDESDLQHERARRIAIGHRVWVAVASFAGSTGEGFTEAAGRSAVWTPDGEIAACAGPEVGAVARATLGVFPR